MLLTCDRTTTALCPCGQPLVRGHPAERARVGTLVRSRTGRGRARPQYGGGSGVRRVRPSCGATSRRARQDVRRAARARQASHASAGRAPWCVLGAGARARDRLNKRPRIHVKSSSACTEAATHGPRELGRARLRAHARYVPEEALATRPSFDHPWKIADHAGASSSSTPSPRSITLDSAAAAPREGRAVAAARTASRARGGAAT